jgi:hypothetical protein
LPWLLVFLNARTMKSKAIQGPVRETIQREMWCVVAGNSEKQVSEMLAQIRSGLVQLLVRRLAGGELAQQCTHRSMKFEESNVAILEQRMDFVIRHGGMVS